jgi:hypothetical protein
MLRELTVEQVQRIATLAKAAREARDAILGNVPDTALGEPPVSRGEHNPASVLGFDPLPPDAPQIAALLKAITIVTPEARSELLTLMRIGRGDLAAGNWARGVSETSTLGDEAVAAALKEDVDLHDHLTKGLYELKLD